MVLLLGVLMSLREWIYSFDMPWVITHILAFFVILGLIWGLFYVYHFLNTFLRGFGGFIPSGRMIAPFKKI